MFELIFFCFVACTLFDFGINIFLFYFFAVRVCIVEGRGTYKKTAIYCPILEQKNSNIECVIGLDRLDCLRRIHKGSAHFGVFSSEDLVAAQWAGVEVLVTSEMRFNNGKPQKIQIASNIEIEFM